jgi:hypothetical protein
MASCDILVRGKSHCPLFLLFVSVTQPNGLQGSNLILNLRRLDGSGGPTLVVSRKPDKSAIALTGITVSVSQFSSAQVTSGADREQLK